MAILPIKYNPNGKMNKDDSYAVIRNGDYVDANNIRHTTTTGNTTFEVENILGNELAFDLGSVTAQNKTYRIKFVNNIAYTYSIVLKDQNKVSWGTASFAASASMATTLSDAETQIDGVLTGASQTATYTTDAVNGYLYITISTITGNEYYVTGTVTGTTDEVEIVVTAEAIDGSLAGEVRAIGSYDLNGELFVFGTSQNDVPTEHTITGATNASPIVISVPAGHGLATGEQTRIFGVNGNTAANGWWIVTVINSTTFSLDGSTGNGAWSSGGKLIRNPLGYGTVHHATRNQVTGVWTVTKLIGAKGLNFRSPYRIDSQAEKNNVKTSKYFTDFYNRPKVLYYSGDIVANGLLNYINAENSYDYETIGDESRLISGSPNVTMALTQYYTGGFLPCGLYRYAVRFLADYNSGETEWTWLSNEVPVTDTNGYFASMPAISGSESNRYNTITVSGIPLNLYKYAELASVYWTTGQTGVEPTISGKVVRKVLIPDGADSVTISHIGNEATTDLDVGELPVTGTGIAKAQNIRILDNRLVMSKLELDYDIDLTDWANDITYSIQTQSVESIGDTSSLLRDNEYARASNCYNYKGYTIFETYRLGIQVKWKGGSWSTTYHIDDIIIDASGASGQRTGGLATYNITTTDATDSYLNIPFIRFTNVDKNYILSDGRVLADLIDGFRFVVAEVESPTVLATGALILSEKPASVHEIGYDAWTPTAYTGSNTERSLGFFVSPELLVNGGQIVNESGDKIRILGQTEQVYNDPAVSAEFNGYVSGVTSYGEYNVLDFQEIEENSSVSISSMTAVTSTPLYGEKMHVVTTDEVGGFVKNSSEIDYGVYYAVYYRANASQYPAVKDTRYYPTGTICNDMDSLTASTTFDVFGGDTYTQKSFYRIRTDAAAGKALGFYSQNRFNAQLKQNIAGTSVIFPSTNPIIASWINNTIPQTAVTDRAYSAPNTVNNYLAYDEALVLNGDAGTRIIYSESKPQGGIADQYRVFLPLNYKDLTLSNGYIEGMEVLNGELVTLQQRAIERQYFNSTGLITTNDSTEVLIGDGSVLSRRGMPITAFGCNHKWSIIKGKSAGGNDVLYWINTELRKALRLGYDGTVSLGEVKGMSSFLANNLNIVDQYTGANKDYGIFGVFNQRHNEAIWTIRAVNPDGVEWQSGESYEVGDLVYSASSTTFEGLPDYFVCIDATNAGSATYEPGGYYPALWETAWERVDRYNNVAYNFYTLVFSESKNAFTCFNSPKPFQYIQFKETYLSPSPISPVSNVFEHDKGEYCRWYEQERRATGYSITLTLNSTIAQATGGTTILDLFTNLGGGTTYYITFNNVDYEVLDATYAGVITLGTAAQASAGIGNFSYKTIQEDNGNLEGVVNYDPNIIKHWLAQSVFSYTTPYRIEYTTKNHESFVDEADFNGREDRYDVAIKNDSTSTGVATGDTTQLYGVYLKVNFIYKKLTLQRLFNFITKGLVKNRNYNK